MIGKALQGHRVVRLKLGQSCDTTECGRALFLRRCDSVTLYQHPAAPTLRRAWGWQEHPFNGPSLERVAFHEAGHVVLCEWLQLDGMRAVATTTSGQVDFMHALPKSFAEVPSDKAPELAATAAAVFHAGTAAEFLHAGMAWKGPVLRMEQPDHRNAELMLAPHLGAHSSGGHAYAQRVALHVLSHRWARVREIADVLICTGAWQT